MELDRALAQLSEIHAQVMRGDVFRGYRAAPMSVTGLLAIGAAAVQDRVWPATDGLGFAGFWVAVAGVALAVHAADLVVTLRRQDWPTVRRRALPVVAQFLPTIVAGATITVVLARRLDHAAALLPGLWALVFSLGIFASRPYLPRAVGWVAAYYLVCGTMLLATSEPAVLPSPWTMGLTFGAGQITFAAVMHVQLERGTGG